MDPLHSTLQSHLQLPTLRRLPRVLVVACSGGADSVALLRAAMAAAPALGWRVEALHCDHGLRREAKADAAFVAALCGRLGVRLHAFATRVGKGPGMEARARVWRQKCYVKAAKTAGARLVLLAQHAQDQAETLLLNLARGAGAAGAAAMLPLTPLEGTPGVLLGRPWLGAMPQALRAWLKKQKQVWREDSSNQDQALARNRVRHAILPGLLAVNPKAIEHLAAYAASLSASKESKDLAGLLKLDRATRLRAQAVLAKGQGQTDLGRGWTLRASRGRVLVESSNHAETLPSLTLRVGAAQAWGLQWNFMLKLDTPTARKLKQDNVFWIALPALEQGLRVRPLRAGDRLPLFGRATGSKLLNDLLAEAGIPAWQRPRWPVLEAGFQVLGLPGLRRGRGFEALPGRKALCLQWVTRLGKSPGQA